LEDIYLLEKKKKPTVGFVFVMLNGENFKEQKKIAD